MTDVIEQLKEHGPQTLEQVAAAVRQPAEDVQQELIQRAARKEVHWEIDGTFWNATPGMPEELEQAS